MDLITGILIFGAVPASLFVVGFGVFDPWWRTAFGLHIMAYSLVVAVILDLAVYNRLVGDLPDWVGPALYACLALVIWQRLILLTLGHLRARRNSTSKES